jgi:predicted transcriptional regulator
MTVTPRPMGTPDLAGLLAKPPRPRPAPAEPVADLGDSDTSLPTQAGQQVTAPTKSSEHTTQNPAPTPPQRGASIGSNSSRRSRTAEPPPRTKTPGREYLRSMPISLPRSLHQRLAERARADGNTRTAIILTAVNRSHDSIGVALNPPSIPSGNDLFDIPQRGPRKEPSVETTIRVTDRQQSAIEALAETHQVNRSRLISTALEVYLS